MDDPAYIRYAVCKEMGWDYHTYEQQPADFIEDILTFLAFDVSIQKVKLVEAKQRAQLNLPTHGRN